MLLEYTRIENETKHRFRECRKQEAERQKGRKSMRNGMTQGWIQGFPKGGVGAAAHTARVAVLPTLRLSAYL